MIELPSFILLKLSSLLYPTCLARRWFKIRAHKDVWYCTAGQDVDTFQEYHIIFSISSYSFYLFSLAHGSMSQITVIGIFNAVWSFSDWRLRYSSMTHDVFLIAFKYRYVVSVVICSRQQVMPSIYYLIACYCLEYTYFVLWVLLFTILTRV